jgi:hypothetical protein
LTAKGPYIKGEHFDRYCQNTLIKPTELDYGEDHPLEYDLKSLDTTYTTRFQQRVTSHYQAVQEITYKSTP